MRYMKSSMIITKIVNILILSLIVNNGYAIANSNNQTIKTTQRLNSIMNKSSDTRKIPIIIVIKDNVDQEKLGYIANNVNNKREYISNILEINSRISQRNILNILNQYHMQYPTNISKPNALWIINAIAVSSDKEYIQRISEFQEVDYISYDEPVEMLAEWNIEQIKAPAVWNEFENQGDEVIIAVLDTGLSHGYPEYNGKIWINEEEIIDYQKPGESINCQDYITTSDIYKYCENDNDDDDFDDLPETFKDDFIGWNFGDEASGSGNNPFPGVSDGIDITVHGDYVSSVIAGTINSLGYDIGVSPASYIMPLRVYGFQAGSYWLLSSYVFEAIQYAIKHDADVINMSLGVNNHKEGSSENEYNNWNNAISNAIDAGIPVIVAAGNNGTCWQFPDSDCDENQIVPYNIKIPAVFPNVITVGATDESDLIWQKSSIGPAEHVVPDDENITSRKPDIVAPGALSIRVYNGTGGFNESTRYNSNANGTSLSAAHVSGVVALIIHQNRTEEMEALLPEEIKNILKLSADQVGGQALPNNTYGWGRVNAYKALKPVIYPKEKGIAYKNLPVYSDIIIYKDADSDELEMLGVTLDGTVDITVAGPDDPDNIVFSRTNVSVRAGRNQNVLVWDGFINGVLPPEGIPDGNYVLTITDKWFNQQAVSTIHVYESPLKTGLALAHGWNFIGVSGITDETVDTFFRSRYEFARVQYGEGSNTPAYSLWNDVYGFNPQFVNQSRLDDPEEGTAYFLYNQYNPTTISVYGTPSNSDEHTYKVHLDQGWNMFSNPFTNRELDWGLIDKEYIKVCDLSEVCYPLLDVNENTETPHLVDGPFIFNQGDSSFGELVPDAQIESWKGYFIKARAAGLSILFDTGECGSCGEPEDKSFQPREVSKSVPSSEGGSKSLARMMPEDSRSGARAISVGIGEIRDVDLYAIDVNKLMASQFTLKWDESMLAAYSRTAGRVLRPGDDVPMEGAMETVLISEVGNSIDVALGNFEEGPSDRVYLGTVSFKVLSGALGKATKIDFDTNDSQLRLVGEVDSREIDYEVQSDPIVFAEYSYSDTTPPVITVEAPCEEGVSNCVTTNTRPTIRVRVTDPESWVNFETLELQMDGKRVVPEIDTGTGEVVFTPAHPLFNKKYDMFIKASGLLSPWSVKSWEFTVDTTPVEISTSDVSGQYISPNDDGVYEDISLHFDVGGDGVFSASVVRAIYPDDVIATLLVETAITGGSGPHLLTWDGTDDLGAVVPDGEYVIRITGAGDDDGLEAVAEVPVVVDTEAPQLSTYQPTGLFLDTRPWVTILARDSGSGLDATAAQGSMDGSPYGPFDGWNVLFSSGYDQFYFRPADELAPELHNVTARVFDKAGNMSEQSWSFEVEDVPQVEITSVTPGVFNPAHGGTSFFVHPNKTVLLEPWISSDGKLRADLADVTAEAGVDTELTWSGAWDSDGASRDGVYTLHLDGSYKGSGFHFDTGTVTVDTVAPVVTVTGVTPAAPGTLIVPGGQVEALFSFEDNFAAAGTVDAVVRDAQDAVVATLVSGAALAANTTMMLSWDGTDAAGQPAGDGTFHIEISVADEAQNTGTAVVPVVVDAAGPVFSFEAPGDGAEAGTLQPVVSVKISDAGAGVDAGGLSMSLDGDVVAATWNAEAGQLSFSADFDPQAPDFSNEHSVSVTAADALGNESVHEWSFVLDGTEPAIVEFVQPADGAAVSGDVDVLVRVYDNENGVGIANTRLFLDGDPAGESDAAPIAGFMVPTAGLADGAHELSVEAVDAAGNMRTESITVFVDNVAPVIDSVTVAPGPGLSPNGNSDVKEISFSSSITETSSYVYTLEIGTGDKAADTWAAFYSVTQDVDAGEAPEVVAWSGLDDGGAAVSEGEYVYYVTVVDAAGLEAVSQGAVYVDSTPPAVSLTAPAAGLVLSGDIDMTAAADDALSGIAGVEYVLTPLGAGSAVRGALAYDDVADAYTFTWHTAEPDDGAYTLLAEAHDATGNMAQTAPIDLTVANAPASVANAAAAPNPFAPAGNGPNTSTAFTFTVTTNVAMAVDWTLEVGEDIGGVWTVHRVFTGSMPYQAGVLRHDAGPVAWDGKDTTGNILNDGTYQYKIAVQTYDSIGTPAAAAEYDGGEVTVDSTPPVVAGAAAMPDFFNPDGNDVDDETALSAAVTEAGAYTARVEILCGAGNSECAAQFGAGAVRVFEETYAAGEQPGFAWDGTWDDGGQAQPVPDGAYTARFTAVDDAGNTSSAADAALTKDNPPVISVQAGPVAFSPNGDTSKDNMLLDWSADQDGIFTFTVYDEGDTQVTVIAQDESYAGGVTHTLTWDGGGLGQGVYKVEITGRDAASSEPNPCIPMAGQAILDVTAPAAAPFYPYQDEFTWLRPKLKVDVSDNLSGFGADAQEAAAAVSFQVSGHAGALPTTVKNLEEGGLSLRVWTRPDPELTVGPHTLSVTAMDLAGNTTTLGPLRFVTIEPFEDDFDGADLSAWKQVSIHGAAGTATLDNGSLVLGHSNSQPDDGAPPMDVYGLSLVGRGVYDVSRQEVLIELNGFDETGSGDLHGAGVTLTEVAGNRFPRKLYLIKSGEQVTAFYEDDVADTLAWSMMDDVAGPADLKIEYEEGVAAFLVNGQVLRTVNVQLTNAVAGLVSMSGFEGSGGSGSSAQVQSYWSNLAGPVMQSVALDNDAAPGASEILLDNEQYILSAQGTPWQKHVQGRVYNVLRVGQTGNVDVALEKLTIGAEVPMEETAEGSGEYMSAPVLTDTYTDAQGYETAYLTPFTRNEWFPVLPLENTDYAVNSGDWLKLVTRAVESVAFSNADNPAGYAYIVPGEHFRVQANTRPGDWDLNAYLFNPETLTQTGSFDDALIAGPMTMLRNSDISYEIQGLLDTAQDATGAQAANILARVVYGPADSEYRPADQSLAVGEPLIRYVTVSNADRSGAGDVVVDEIMRIRARAQDGQNLVAMLFNPDNPILSQSLVQGPHILTPDAAMPGWYTVDIPLERGFDKTGLDLTRVQAVTMTQSGQNVVLGNNTLDVLEGDDMPPAAPADAVAVTSAPETPQFGETVNTTISWTAPNTDRNGGDLADLTGYRIYRVTEHSGYSALTPVSGAPAPDVTLNPDGTYNMADTALAYGGADFDSTLINDATANWLAPGEAVPAALPMSNSDLIEPGRDIHAFAVQADFNGSLLFPQGQYTGTLYSQMPREGVEQWLLQLEDWGMASNVSVAASAIAFHAQPDHSFTPAGAMDAEDYFTHEPVTTVSADTPVFADSYEYNGTTYSHKVAGMDTAGNVGLSSPAASVPASSLSIIDAQLANGPETTPTGYIQPGQSWRLTVTASGDTDLAAAQAYLLNRGALSEGAPFGQSIVHGPLGLTPDPQQPGGYMVQETLPALTDTAGRTAAEMAAVITLPGWEDVTAQGMLKGGVAPVRTVALANASRPGHSDIFVTETVEVTAQGNSGLALIATLMNPAGAETQHGTPMDQGALTLVETPAGSGHYQGQATVDTLLDTQGQTAENLTVIVSDTQGKVDPAVPGDQALALRDTPQITGAIALQPDWLLSGWSLNGAYDITNNAAELVQDIEVSAAVLMPGGQQAYTVTQTWTLNPGETLTGLALDFGPVHLSPGAYQVALSFDLDGFAQQLAAATLNVGEDLVAADITTDRSNYLSGETITVDYTLENTSGLVLPELETALRLRDDTGAVITTMPGPTFQNMAAGQTETGTLNITTPPGLSIQKYYRLELAGILNGSEDTAAEKLVPVLPQKILVTGLPLPDHIIQYQEPLFNYIVTNQTAADITDGIITGEVQPTDYNQGDPPLATFTETIAELATRDSSNHTSTFSPVGPEPGEYIIVIYTQADQSAPRIKAMETPIWVETCGP